MEEMWNASLSVLGKRFFVSNNRPTWYPAVFMHMQVVK
jgi:hypothetical protein